MNYPERRPSVAASDPVDPREGGDTGAAAVEALARILDPVAFEPCAIRANVGQLWDEFARRRVALAHAERALAAGYRLVPEGSS
jgi:hypothetical protein